MPCGRFGHENMFVTINKALFGERIDLLTKENFGAVLRKTNVRKKGQK